MALFGVLWRALLLVGFLGLLLAVGVFGMWNTQLVEIRTPYGPQTAAVFLVVLGSFAAGLVLMFVLMSCVNVSQGLRAGRIERELRSQVAEQDQLLRETDLRLADYEDKARAFTLQVMQITHALGAPLDPPPNLALPPRPESREPDGA